MNDKYYKKYLKYKKKYLKLMNKQFIGGELPHWSCKGLLNPTIKTCTNGNKEFKVCGRNEDALEANEEAVCGKDGKFKLKNVISRVRLS